MTASRGSREMGSTLVATAPVSFGMPLASLNWRRAKDPSITIIVAAESTNGAQSAAPCGAQPGKALFAEDDAMANRRMTLLAEL